MMMSRLKFHSRVPLGGESWAEIEVDIPDIGRTSKDTQEFALRAMSMFHDLLRTAEVTPEQHNRAMAEARQAMGYLGGLGPWRGGTGGPDPRTRDILGPGGSGGTANDLPGGGPGGGGASRG